EKVIASNSKISKIESISRSNSSVITLFISDNLKDVSTVLDDVGGRLAAIRNLPDGAGPIHSQRDFGAPATLLRPVASPNAHAAEVEVRAAKIREAIEATRAKATRNSAAGRATLVLCFPLREDFRLTRLGAIDFMDYLRRTNTHLDPLLLDGAGCIGADV